VSVSYVDVHFHEYSCETANYVKELSSHDPNTYRLPVPVHFLPATSAFDIHRT